MTQYTVTGMSCAACQARVEKAVSAVPGVEKCAVSLLTNSMGVDGDAAPERIIAAVEKAGYGASLKNADGREKARTGFAAEEEALKDRETPVLKKRLFLSVLFLLVLMYIGMGHMMLGFPLPRFLAGNVLSLTLTQMLLAAAVMIINHKFFTGGIGALLHGAPNMDTLVALGSSVSFGWSVCVFYRICGAAAAGSMEAAMELYHGQLYFESAAMIPALITVGKLLEAISKGRTTDALKSLLRLAPKTARLYRDGAETEVPVEEIREGDLFAVRPGDSIPVDAVVTEGEGAVDESALTGESVPVDKAPGSRVSAATINRNGYLICRADRVGEDTTLAQIIRMVSDAAATKAPIARIADTVSGYFVPAVILIAAVCTIGWLIAGAGAGAALERGICVLVISCPCALGLATPVAIMVGNGLGARNGILFKTSEALEVTGRADIVALDKTGTITAGRPQVTDILPAAGFTEERLLTLACSLEKLSEHPLAGAVVEAAEAKGISAAEVYGFRALPGNGLTAESAEGRLTGGSLKYVSSVVPADGNVIDRAKALAAEGKTPLLFALEDRLAGMIAVADVLKPDSAEAITELRALGMEVIMLTGDNAVTAEAVGKEAGVSDVISGILPDGKEAVIRSLKDRGRVIMIGDGINDAPALKRADTGIAIGAGTDVAIDSADVVLSKSSLKDAAAAIRLSRAVLKNIRENLFWAFFYNVICIPLAAGLFRVKMSPMIGAAAMSISSFTVCMNALRLNLFRPYDTKHDRPRRGRRLKPGTGQTDAGPGETEGAAPAEEESERNDTVMNVKIEGMMCSHCEATVKKALEALPFVETAAPSHEKGIAVLTLCGEADEEMIRRAIEEKDYTYIGIA